MNVMVQQASEADIALFANKAEGDKKKKDEAEMKHIDKELDELIPTGSIISKISGTEDIPDDDRNIGLESNKYGATLVKISCIYTYCIAKIGNRISLKNTKEVVDNYSHTQTKYSNESFNIIDNVIHSKKKSTTQYNPVSYGALILAINAKYLRELVR